MNIISEKLVEIEQTENITILYACEAGSRAFGYNTSGSDYDVRFLYVHPPEWYLSVFPKPDVVEHSEVDMEFQGWDLRKALQLLTKSNPSILEWLASPIVYHEKEEVKKIRKLSEDCLSLKRLLFHYSKMGKTNLKVFNERCEQKLLLYSLKSVLFGRWSIINQSLPGDSLQHLLYGSDLDKSIKVDCFELLDRKELVDTTLLQTFLESELEKLEKAAKSFDQRSPVDCSLVDKVFRYILNQ